MASRTVLACRVVIDPEWPDPDRSLNAVNDGHRRYFTRYVEEQLEGHDDLIEKSVPTYPPFGKRIVSTMVF